MSERVRTLAALAHNKKGVIYRSFERIEKVAHAILNYGKIIKLRLE